MISCCHFHVPQIWDWYWYPWKLCYVAHNWPMYRPCSISFWPSSIDENIPHPSLFSTEFLRKVTYISKGKQSAPWNVFERIQQKACHWFWAFHPYYCPKKRICRLDKWFTPLNLFIRKLVPVPFLFITTLNIILLLPFFVILKAMNNDNDDGYIAIILIGK